MNCDCGYPLRKLETSHLVDNIHYYDQCGRLIDEGILHEPMWIMPTDEEIESEGRNQSYNLDDFIMFQNGWNACAKWFKELIAKNKEGLK